MDLDFSNFDKKMPSECSGMNSIGMVELLMTFCPTCRFFKDFQPSYVQIGFMVWSGIAKYEEKKCKE